MGQKINPVSLRLQSSNRCFDNSWYSNYFYTNLITQDLFLQNYLNNFLKGVKLPTGRYSIQHLPKKTQVYNFLGMDKQTREWRSRIFGLLKRKNSLKKTRYFFKTKRQGKRQVQSSTKLISFYKAINPLAVYKIQKKFTSFQNFQLWSHLLKTPKNKSPFLNSKTLVSKFFQTSPFFIENGTTKLMRNTLKSTTLFHPFGLVEKIKKSIPLSSPKLVLEPKGSRDQKTELLLHKNDDSFHFEKSRNQVQRFRSANLLELTTSENSCLLFLQNLFVYKTLKATPLKTKQVVNKKDLLIKNNKKTREFHFSEFNVLNFKYRNYLERELSNFFNKQIELIPFKVKSDWQNATTLADEIVYFLEKRVPFRRLKSNLLKQLSKNPQIRGVRITCSGRGGGKSKKAQRAKTECIKYGQTSLHVLSSPIDFAVKTAFTSFGSVGVKVWISFN